jgi:hypothetical protein
MKQLWRKLEFKGEFGGNFSKGRYYMEEAGIDEGITSKLILQKPYIWV